MREARRAPPAREPSPPRAIPRVVPREVPRHFILWLWELGSGWLAAVAASAILAVLLCNALQARWMDAWQYERLALSLQQVAYRAAANLPQEPLARSPDALQRALDAVLQQDPTVRTVEIYSAAGVALLSTDRGSIGERLLPEWHAALARATGNFWVVVYRGSDEYALGVPIIDAGGRTTGHVVATAMHASAANPARLMQLPHYLAAVVAVAILLVVLVCTLQPVALQVTAEARALEGSLPAAEHPLAPVAVAVRQRIEETERRLEAALDELGAERKSP